MGRKWLALSFDDGTPNDVELVALLNRYGVKATFHLNAGMIPLDGRIGPNDHLPLTVLSSLYAGHEVAAHSYSHPDLTRLSEAQIMMELQMDIDRLKPYFKQDIRGFAYPYGTFNQSVIDQLKKTPIRYARTIRDSYRFDLPKDLYLLDPTCHFADPRLMDLTSEFLKENDEDQFFLVWGHSYELRTEEDWSRFESFLKVISHRKDVCSETILHCVDSMNSLCPIGHFLCVA